MAPNLHDVGDVPDASSLGWLAERVAEGTFAVLVKHGVQDSETQQEGSNS